MKHVGGSIYSVREFKIQTTPWERRQSLVLTFSFNLVLPQRDRRVLSNPISEYIIPVENRAPIDSTDTVGWRRGYAAQEI